MSTGRSDDGVRVERESLKSEARMRNNAVWAKAERGTLRWCAVEATKLLSHAAETGSDLVLRSWRAICSSELAIT